MSRLSQQPSDPVYYIEDCRIFYQFHVHINRNFALTLGKHPQNVANLSIYRKTELPHVIIFYQKLFHLTVSQMQIHQLQGALTEKIRLALQYT